MTLNITKAKAPQMDSLLPVDLCNKVLKLVRMPEWKVFLDWLGAQEQGLLLSLKRSVDHGTVEQCGKAAAEYVGAIHQLGRIKSFDKVVESVLAKKGEEKVKI